MKRFLLPLIALAALFASCEKTLDIDDNAELEWVLNGIPSAGKQAFVYFANTRFFLDSSYNHPVDDATMTLTVNGTPMSPDSVFRCKYFFNYILQEDDSLSIDIVGGDHHVHAETYVPLLPNISHFQASRFASNSFNFYTVDIQFNDHPQRKEYYSVLVSVRDSGMRYNEWADSLELVDTVRSTFFLVPYNPEITSNDVCPYVPLGGYLYSRIMFKDDLIDGQQDNLSLYIFNTVDTNERPPFKHEYFVQMESVTPARWNYIISSSQQAGSFSLFAEQGEVWSNVEGALGIFSGTAKREFVFDPDTLPAATPTTLPLVSPLPTGTPIPPRHMPAH